MGNNSCSCRIDYYRRFILRTVAERNEENLLIDGNFDRKVILNQLIKDYRFDKRDEAKEYVYEVVYLINVVLPRVGTILEERQVLDLNINQKVNFEIKTSKATIVR